VLASYEAKGLKRAKVANGLKWLGVKHLKPSLSSQHQLFAGQHADKLELAPIHLDILYGRSEKVVNPVNDHA
jgi:hypothetical protein